jgi:uncharacterized protein with NAD-binding domain and iron-sulfur cluster
VASLSGQQTPKKVAIIGGGMGALTAAYFLTDPAAGGEFDVTVYTMGWRLGGKGASGRNEARNDRIEEHGLHIWFGTYHNAIALMQSCYTELGRPAGVPLATFGDAFKGQSRLVLLESVQGQSRPWGIDFPEMPGLSGGATVLDLLNALIKWVRSRVLEAGPLAAAPLAPFHASLGTGDRARLATVFGTPDLLPTHNVQHLADGVSAKALSLSPGDPISSVVADGLSLALKLLANTTFAVLKPRLPGDDFSRRLWILLYLGVTFARGMLDDRLYERGFDAVETIEMRAWLASHSSFAGSSDQAQADGLAFESANIQAFYDASFSYVDGDATQPNVAASVALRCMLRILFDYSGPMILEMQAGMGDTVFAPMYLVLMKRGVRFAFFNRLADLHLDATGALIDQIDLSQQVQIPDATRYQPLYNVEGLPCWPSEPFYGQITDGAALKVSGQNIEHWDSGWTDTGPVKTLKRGQDFDHVVLGISYDVLPFVSAELCANPQWKAMIQGLDTADTQAAQLWFADNRAQLGMIGPPEIFGGYIEPWSSLTDFSHLLPRESWPQVDAPAYLNYTCGPLAKSAAPGGDDAVYARLRDFLHQDAGPLWPRAVGAGGFDYDVLYAPAGAVGEARLQAQYWRANTDPTERYVIAKAATAGVRLEPGATGFANLSVVGEWTDTGVNISSIEATVISGMRASRALTGQPVNIPGEADV